MTDLLPPAVPTPDDRWVAARRGHLVAELAATPAGRRPAAWSRPGGPAPRLHRPLVWVASGTGAAAAASVAAVVALAGPGTPAAFAGWSATPTTPAHGQLAAAVTSCGSVTAPAGQVVLEDARGPFTLVTRAEASDGTSCLTGPEGTTQTIEASLGTSAAAGSVQLVGALSTLAGQPVGVVMGEVGSGVTGVTVTLQDGTPVTASVAGGWFAAWWPTGQRATTMTVASATGATTCAVTALPELPPPGPSGAPSGTGASPVTGRGSGGSGAGSSGTGQAGGDHAGIHRTSIHVSVRGHGSTPGSVTGSGLGHVRGYVASCPAG